MSNPTTNLSLFIDLKTQDKLRKWFSERDNGSPINIKNLALGDSDVDYKLSLQVNKIRPLPAPYEVPRIMSNILYKGNVGNITGVITAYLRRVNNVGQVESLYNHISGFSGSLNFTNGTNPPVINNEYDWNSIPFTQTPTTKEGFIVFLQTLPDNYFEIDGVTPKRLIETYDISFDNINFPSTWEAIIDDLNGSFLLAVPNTYTFGTNIQQIKVKGRISGIIKFLTFIY